MLEISISLVCPIIGLLLLFWYKTEFVPEYGRLLGLRKLLAIEKYEKAREFNPNLSYQMFVATNYNRFLHRLINCTVCLGTWLSIFSTGLVAVFLGEYLYLTMIPFNTLGGISLYLLIKKLI